MSASWQAVVSALVVFLCGGATSCRARPSAADLVFVSNEDSGEVSIIDSSTDAVIATIAVGRRPRGIRVSRDGSRVFVAVTGSPKAGPGAARAADRERGGDERDADADGIVVIDVAKRRVVDSLRSGRDPEAFDISSDGRAIWVSNEETSEVSMLDVGGHRILATVKVGAEPEGVTLTPDGRNVYVTSEAASEVAIIRASTREVTTRIPTGSRPRAIAFTPDGTKALVSAELGGTLEVIDTQSASAVGRIRTGGPGVKPMGVAVTDDGRRAFVANGREGSVGIVDVASRKLEGTIANVGVRPWGVALGSGGDKLYVAAVPDVAVIDTKTNRVTKRIRVGEGPWGVAVARRSP